MPEISEKQSETEDLHNLPFDAKIFQNTFNGYIRKFNTIFATLIILVCAPFVAYVIAWYLELTKVDITGFLDLWHASGDLLLDLGVPSHKLRHIFIRHDFSRELLCRISR